MSSNPTLPMARKTRGLAVFVSIIGLGYIGIGIFHGLVVVASRWQGRSAPTFSDTANAVKDAPLDILGSGYSPPVSGGWLIYVLWWLIIIGLVVLCLRIFWRITKKQTAKRTGQTTAEDVGDLSFKAAVKASKGVVPATVSKRDSVVTLGEFEGSEIFGQHKDSACVIAPSQSGKTSVLGVPWVLDSLGPTLAATAKNDLVYLTYHHRYKNHGPAASFDPSGVAGLQEWIRWSPVHGCEEDLDEALKRGAALASGGRAMENTGNMQFFDDLAGMMLSMYLHAAARKSNGSMRDVMRWASDFADREPLRLLNDSPLAVSAGWPDLLRGNTDSKAEQTVGSLKMTLMRTLRPLQSPRVMELVCPDRSEATFDVDAFLNSTGTLYVLSETDQGSVAPLVTMLTDHVIRRAQKVALSHENNRLWPPFRAVIDEATNIAPLPNMAQMMSDTGGRGISLRVLVQTVAQMEETWGQKGAAAIRGNAAAEYYLPGIKEPELLKELSERTTKYRATRTSVSTGHKQGEASMSSSTEYDYAMQPQDITQMKLGKALLFYRNQRYMEVDLPPFWERKDYATIQEGVRDYEQLKAIGGGPQS